jgi:hypothetical protein
MMNLLQITEIVEYMMKEEKLLISNLARSIKEYIDFITMKESLGRFINKPEGFDAKTELKNLIDKIYPDLKLDESYKQYFGEYPPGIEAEQNQESVKRRTDTAL